MDLSTFFIVFLDGIVLGTLYGSIGLGLSLVYGLMGILNFSHAQFYVLAIYLAIMSSWFIPIPYFAFVVSLALLSILSYTVYKALIVPIFRYGVDAAMMNTFALSYFLEVTILLIFGPYYQKAVALFPLGVSTTIPGGGSYSAYRIFAFIVAIITLIITMLFIRKTMFGKALRAVMQDPKASLLMGINIYRTTLWGFVLSTALAGIAGMLLAPMYLVYPAAGARIGLIAFVVAVVGGMGEIEGAIFAGILIGVAESLGSVYVSSAYRDAIIFAVLIITLLVRPRGIKGRK